MVQRIAVTEVHIIFTASVKIVRAWTSLHWLKYNAFPTLGLELIALQIRFLFLVKFQNWDKFSPNSLKGIYIVEKSVLHGVKFWLLGLQGNYLGGQNRA